MQHVKITKTGPDSRLMVGFTYTLERLDSGLLRLTSVGGKFSCLVNPDTSQVEFELTDAPALPLKGWRNDYAAKLWCDASVAAYADGETAVDAIGIADTLVAAFKERWEGTTFLHKGE